MTYSKIICDMLSLRRLKLKNLNKLFLNGSIINSIEINYCILMDTSILIKDTDLKYGVGLNLQSLTLNNVNIGEFIGEFAHLKTLNLDLVIFKKLELISPKLQNFSIINSSGVCFDNINANNLSNLKIFMNKWFLTKTSSTITSNIDKFINLHSLTSNIECIFDIYKSKLKYIKTNYNFDQILNLVNSGQITNIIIKTKKFIPINTDKLPILDFNFDDFLL